MPDEPSIEVTKTTSITTPVHATGFRGLDSVLLLLMCGIVFFTLMLIFVEWLWKDQADLFQVVSNVLSAFVGAFLLRVKPPSEK